MEAPAAMLELSKRKGLHRVTENSRSTKSHKVPVLRVHVCVGAFSVSWRRRLVSWRRRLVSALPHTPPPHASPPPTRRLSSQAEVGDNGPVKAQRPPPQPRLAPFGPVWPRSP
uniref:Uncharacterized protein n=1 Tax=Knipowitschia caucasica TaxID=637954 RepID=A0AAV2J3Y2_KNICA